MPPAPALVVAGGVNLLAFCVFGYDKTRARRNARRIPENRLLLLALLGGWIGAWTGVKVFRHKTRKTSFLARLAVATLLALAWMIPAWRSLAA